MEKNLRSSSFVAVTLAVLVLTASATSAFAQLPAPQGQSQEVLPAAPQQRRAPAQAQQQQSSPTELDELKAQVEALRAAEEAKNWTLTITEDMRFPVWLILAVLLGIYSKSWMEKRSKKTATPTSLLAPPTASDDGKPGKTGPTAVVLALMLLLPTLASAQSITGISADNVVVKEGVAKPLTITGTKLTNATGIELVRVNGNSGVTVLMSGISVPKFRVVNPQRVEVEIKADQNAAAGNYQFRLTNSGTELARSTNMVMVRIKNFEVADVRDELLRRTGGFNGSLKKLEDALKAHVTSSNTAQATVASDIQAIYSRLYRLEEALERKADTSQVNTLSTVVNETVAKTNGNTDRITDLSGRMNKGEEKWDATANLTEANSVALLNGTDQERIGRGKFLKDGSPDRQLVEAALREQRAKNPKD